MFYVGVTCGREHTTLSYHFRVSRSPPGTRVESQKADLQLDTAWLSWHGILHARPSQEVYTYQFVTCQRTMYNVDCEQLSINMQNVGTLT